MVWAITIGVIALAGIFTDMLTTNKKTELKRLEAEIKLEQLKLATYEKETEKLTLELEQTRQLMLEKRDA